METTAKTWYLFEIGNLETAKFFLDLNSRSNYIENN